MRRMPGFTLIEFLLAFMLVSGILAVLFNVLFFTMSMLRVTDMTIDQDTRAMVFDYQMFKDVSSMTLPYAHLQEMYQREKNKKNKDKATQKESPIDQYICFTENIKEGGLKKLAFLSTHALSMYEPDQETEHIRYLFIMYQLVPRENNAQVFDLYRKEIPFNAIDKEMQQASQDRGYLMVDGVASLKITFEYPLFKIDEKKKELNVEKIVSKSAWQTGSLLQEKKMQHVLLPQEVVFNLTLWQQDDQESQDYIFRYFLQGFGLVMRHYKLVNGLLSTSTQSQPKQAPKSMPKM